MMLFKQKTDPVFAMQLKKETIKNIEEFVGTGGNFTLKDTSRGYVAFGFVNTDNGLVFVNEDDWVVEYPNKQFKVFSPKLFKRFFEQYEGVI